MNVDPIVIRPRSLSPQRPGVLASWVGCAVSIGVLVFVFFSVARLTETYYRELPSSCGTVLLAVTRRARGLPVLLCLSCVGMWMARGNRTPRVLSLAALGVSAGLCVLIRGYVDKLF